MSKLQDDYREKIVPALKEKLGRSNVHSLPKLQKIVVSMGLGAARDDRKVVEVAVEELGQITGQKPQVCRARKSVAQFRLRQGMEVGARVTLRGRRMYEFLDRLVHLALPRVRDFRGINPKAFDGNGNYNMGLNEQLVFPEINPDKAHRQQGMNITFVTSTRSDDEARLLLEQLGLPFSKTTKPARKK